jgi:hypothetical protein
MRIENLPDGSLQIRERWRLLRFACAAAAVLVPATVLGTAWLKGAIAWEHIGGAALGLILPGGWRSWWRIGASCSTRRRAC